MACCSQGLVQGREKRNETVDHGKLVPEKEHRIALVDSNNALKMILGEALFGLCLSAHICSSREWQSLVC